MDQQSIGSINNVNFKIYSEYTLASVKMDGKSLNNAKGKFSVLANYIFDNIYQKISELEY